jgi:ATP-dependent RNA helicase DOB1
MILNLLRVEGMSPEYMLEQCFYQFQNSNNIPGLENRMCFLLFNVHLRLPQLLELLELEKERDNMVVDRADEIAEYYDIRQQLDVFASDIHAVITHPSYCLPYLQGGRLVKVVLITLYILPHES